MKKAGEKLHSFFRWKRQCGLRAFRQWTIVLFAAIGCGLGMEGQSAPIIAEVSVLHIHDAGWSYHQLLLDLTSETLLISGSQQYLGQQGTTGYCIFPAAILLERIVKVEAKVLRFKPFSNIYAMRLHLEYKDERGNLHSYDFIPGNSVQSYNAWSGGDSDSIRDFAEALENAIGIRMAQLQPAPAAGTRRTPVVDPDTGLQLTGQATQTKPAETNQTSQSASQPVEYDAQMPWSAALRRVHVWPVSPTDHGRIFVEDSETKDVLINIGFEDVVSVTAKQKVVEISIPNPGMVSIPLGPVHGMKVYELCLKMRWKAGKTVTNCMISDLAKCAPGAQCQEGEDGGRDILTLEKAIDQAIASKTEDLKQRPQ